MARKKIKKAGLTFMSLGLEKSEEKKLMEILDEEDISGKRLARKLFRAYIKNKKG